MGLRSTITLPGCNDTTATPHDCSSLASTAVIRLIAAFVVG
jgi:hypothetical protein